MHAYDLSGCHFGDGDRFSHIPASAGSSASPSTRRRDPSLPPVNCEILPITMHLPPTTKKPDDCGVILGEPSDAYHANDAISSSQLLDLDPCPALFFQKHVEKSVPREESAVFDLGTATHSRLLEGMEAYWQRVAVHPPTYTNDDGEVKNWNFGANKCKAFERLAKSQGKLCISEADHALIGRMYQATEQNRDAAALLQGGTPEVTFRFNAGPFRLQCRADKWHHAGVVLPSTGELTGPAIVDLKTCESIEHFRKHFATLRYYFRAEFYRMVVREVLAEKTGTPVHEIPLARFFFVAVEKSAPFRCEVFEMGPDTSARGFNEVQAKITTLRRCYASGKWLGSLAGVQTIDIPQWQARLSDAETDGVLRAA
jgi:hypothetical protein